MGIQPAAPERTAAFLLQLQGEDGLFRFDSVIEESLWNNVSCTYLVSETLRLLTLADISEVVFALARARERVAQLVEEELIRWQGEALDIREDEHLLAVLELLAALGGSFPERGKAALRSFLAAIEHAPTDFLGPIAINNLLDTAERAGLLLPQEIPELPGLRGYCERVAPEIMELGGYGWRVGWAAKLDPVMTWPVVRLFKRAGLGYPAHSTLIAALEIHRIEDGWMTFTLAIPKVDFTFFGVSIAKLTGWRGYDEKKVRAFALSALHQPKNLHQIYWAANLGELVGIERETLQSLIEPVLKVYTTEDLYWLIQVLFEFNLSPSPEIGASLIEVAETLAQRIQGLPHITYIRDLFRLQRLLGRQWITEEQLIELVRSLQDAASGGFKAFPTSPGADLYSTWAAMDIFGRTNGEFDKEKCRSFILSCWWNRGFAWAPQGAALLSSPPDLFSTFVGLKLLQLLDS